MIKKSKYIIIGAGPAGLQMAYFLQEAGADYVVLEKNETAGSFFNKYPIHKKLISINKKYNYFEEESFNMRHDWNSLLSNNKDLRLTNYTEDLFPSADVLYTYLKDYASELQLNIQYNQEVKQISKNDKGEFNIKLENENEWECSVLLMGTGATRPHQPKDIEGIEHTINYGDMKLNPELYRNKRIGVIGGGNTGFEVGDYFAGIAAHVHVFVKDDIKLAWESHFVGDLRAVNNNLLDMYQLKSLHAVLSPRIKKLTKLADGILQTQHEYDYPEGAKPGTLKLSRQYDYMFNCTGFEYTNLSLFDLSAKPETIKDDKFYNMKSNWESTNIPNLYFIGTNMQAIDRKSSSGFIHGFRYNVRSLSRLLLEQYEANPLDYSSYKTNEIDLFLKKLYERFSLSDGLFQLYGFLGDMIVVDNANELKWYEELPLEYIQQKMPLEKPVLTISLEFGFDKHDKSSLEFLGPSDPNNTKLSAFLHPVIRYYYKDEYDEFHFGDSLLGRWDMQHTKGGAIASYHLEFYNWLCSKLGLEKVDIRQAGENPNYQIWSKDD